MCWADKCCFFIPLNIACVILGVLNFVISLSLTIASITYYFIPNEVESDLLTKDRKSLLIPLLGFDFKVETLNIILSIVLIVCLFWMLFSVLLIAGVTKNEPNLILSYFSFGIILTILCQLSGLLMLLNTAWWLALLLFIGSLINIHFLVVVHTVYELMQKGTVFGFRQHQQDEDLLADCFDDTLA